MAVELTFDGTMPCKICLAVTHAKQKESQRAQQAKDDAAKVLLALHVAEPFLMPVPKCRWPEVSAPAALSRTEPVPVPPRRV